MTNILATLFGAALAGALLWYFGPDPRQLWKVLLGLIAGALLAGTVAHALRAPDCSPLLQLAGRTDLYFQCVMERRQ